MNESLCCPICEAGADDCLCETNEKQYDDNFSEQLSLPIQLENDYE